MNIEFLVSTDNQSGIAGAIAGLRKQVPFAIAVALNRTAEEVLAEGRQEIQANFIVRVPRFDLPPTQLPASWRATATRQLATVDLGDNDGGPSGIGARRRHLFTKFEYGNPKIAQDPAFPIAIPTRALRPTPNMLVPRAVYPVNLRLAPRTQADGSTLAALRKGKVRTTSGAAITKTARKKGGLEGIGGTFTMNDASGRPIGVFQRVGTGHRAYRMIWAYRRQIHIPHRMEFAVRGTAIIRERLPINLDGALAFALRTAK